MSEVQYFRGGTTSNTNLIQIGRKQLDTAGKIRLATGFRVLTITNATLVWETAVAKCLPDDKWTEIASFAAVTDTTVHADTTDGATKKLERYVRWRIEAAPNWEICFWMHSTLK